MSITFSTYSAPTIDRGVLDVPESLELNVTNTNGAYLLGALGLPVNDEGDPFAVGDLYGTVDPADFLGRVLLAIAVSPTDAGVPTYETPGTGPQWIECGRREGYLHEKLTVLRSLAEWAVANDCDSITYG